MTLGAPSGRQRRRPDRIATLTVAILLSMAVAAPSANATLRVINHNDPAGDPTNITYSLSTPDRVLVPTFVLPDEDCLLPQDAEHCGTSFGVDPTIYGPTYIIKMVTDGWRTEDIQCIGIGDPGEFTKDPPGLVGPLAVDPLVRGVEGQPSAWSRIRRRQGRSRLGQRVDSHHPPLGDQVRAP
jgi:hypothetical protein